MLQVGDPAPELGLVSDTGETLYLADLQGTRVVLFFYPRDNTSGWTAEALEFQERLAQFEHLGVRVVGVSKDSLVSHKRFRQKHGFTFPLLSDPEHRVLDAYGAWGEKKMAGKVVQGTLRSTVVVDVEGRVFRVYGKVKAKGHAQAVLDDLSA